MVVNLTKSHRTRYYEIDWSLESEITIKAHERLLCESDLTLQKTDEMCHAAESMLAQVKMVDDILGSTVNAVKSENDQQPKPSKDSKNLRECWNCGQRHELY